MFLDIIAFLVIANLKKRKTGRMMYIQTIKLIKKVGMLLLNPFNKPKPKANKLTDSTNKFFIVNYYFMHIVGSI